MVDIPRQDRTISWKMLILELLVVFLGVTAGFVLNNWQEQRRDHHLEANYIERFRQDIRLNKEELEQTIASDSLWFQQLESHLLEIRDQSLVPDSATNIVMRMNSFVKMDPETGTFDDITFSGNLNLIRDFELRQMIVNYYGDIESAQYIDEFVAGFYRDFVIPFVIENFSILQKKLVHPEIIDSTNFGNIVSGYFALVQQRHAAYLELLETGERLSNRLHSD